MSLDRIEKERQFHNERFQDGDNRQSQGKYYWAIEHGSRRFLDRVTACAAGKDVLDYGCSTGDHALALAPIARSYLGIDISDVAIATAQQRAAGLAASFQVADAMATGLPDASFDLVFGSGIVHHLDTERSLREIARLLRPGGIALFWEPLGKNPLINAYRAITPSARTPDEHPLLEADIRIAESIFPRVDVGFYGLTSLMAVPFRSSPIGETMRRVLVGLDERLLGIGPLRYLGWFALIEMRK